MQASPVCSSHILTHGFLLMVLLLVGLGVQQSLQLCGVADLDLGDPGIALGALVDGLSLVVKKGVARHDLSGHRRQNIRCGLY
jgi:hypothetical protein